MYRRSSPGQLSFQDFYLPFGGHLCGDNRWVKLAEFIPWDDLEDHYAEQLDAQLGTPAKPFRVALGALIIQQRLGTSDRETVEQIRENPYLQYFLGFWEYRDSPPFDASSLVHFRKRLTLDILNAINDRITQQAMAAMPAPDAESETDSSQDNDDDDDDTTTNQGQLLLDATCAPADINYPTDLKLLNHARELTEAIIDILYKPIRERFKRKPRTYRRIARQSYLSVAKQRRPSGKMIRKAVGQQLQCLGRNLGHIDRLMAHGASLSQLPTWLYQRLLVIAELFVQQQQMHQTRTHRIDDRIVSLSQPHLRPIVRGKAGTPVEFGAKLSVSCVDGFVFLDRLSWDAFNESGDLPQQVEAFHRRFGHYPNVVQVDRIYRTRANRDYCRDRGIRLSGPPLGRPSVKDAAHLRQQEREDAGIRNAIEGKFGQGKRRFGLDRIRTKLATTSATVIALTLLVMNLERWLRHLLWCFLAWLGSVMAGIRDDFRGVGQGYCPG